MCTLFERLKQGKKNILAPNVVMLDDRKVGEEGGLPPAGREGRVTHFRNVPDGLRVLGRGLIPPGGEDRQRLE